MPCCARAVVTTASDALTALGLDIDEVSENEKNLRERISGDKKLCACGHSEGRHTMASHFVRCEPALLTCPCRTFNPVGTASDTRFFLKNTDGAGHFHALGKGLRLLGKAGGVFTCTVHQCVKCGTDAEYPDLQPVAVSQRGIILDVPSQFNALICGQCRRGL